MLIGSRLGCCLLQEYTWRNVLQFSPTAKYNGYSYSDVVLKPMATAVNKAIR